MSSLPKQVGDNPVLFTQFNGVDSEGQDFAPERGTAHKHGNNGVVPLAPQRLPLRTGEQSLALFGREPVAHADSDPARSLHSSNSGGQFRTEQAGVGRLKCKPAGRHLDEVDRGWCVLLLLEIDLVAQNYGAMGETRL